MPFDEYDEYEEVFEVEVELPSSFGYWTLLSNRMVNSIEVDRVIRFVNSIAGDCGDLVYRLLNSLTVDVDKSFSFKNTLSAKDEVLLSFGFRNHLTENLSFLDQYYFDKGHGLTE